MSKPLKLYNGRVHKNGLTHFGYVAAYSRAEASRLTGMSAGEIKTYWSEGGWGEAAMTALGVPAEPCFWVQDRHTGTFDRQDKKGTIERPAEIDRALLRRVIERLPNYWKPGDLSPNYINIIAADCGWNPLVVGEKMEVGLGGARYEIKRLS